MRHLRRFPDDEIPQAEEIDDLFNSFRSRGLTLREARLATMVELPHWQTFNVPRPPEKLEAAVCHLDTARHMGMPISPDLKTLFTEVLLPEFLKGHGLGDIPTEEGTLADLSFGELMQKQYESLVDSRREQERLVACLRVYRSEGQLEEVCREVGAMSNLELEQAVVELAEAHGIQIGVSRRNTPEVILPFYLAKADQAEGEANAPGTPFGGDPVAGQLLGGPELLLQLLGLEDDLNWVGPDLTEEDGAIYKKGNKLLCNFAVRSIRTGAARYVEGGDFHIHEATVERPSGEQETWLVEGSLFEKGAWQRAGGESTTITSPTRFKDYLHHAVDRDEVREYDPQLNVVYVAGTYCDEAGRTHFGDGVQFPFHDECVYNGVRFPRTGDKDTFEALAALSTDNVIRGALVYICGAGLKPALGFYPHLVMTGDKESGKTTQAEHLCRLFGGLHRVSAPTEFGTAYRREKCLSNTNIPVFADEIGRLDAGEVKGLVDTLNLAYNSHYSTRGREERTFVLYSPLVMLGQDFHVRDEACSSKLLRLRLHGGSKDSEALRKVEELDEPFPLGDYMGFLAQWASENDVRALLRSEAERLAGELGEGAQDAGTEVDRTVTNYASQLVACGAVQDYGLTPPPRDFYVERAREHVEELRETGSNIAGRFLADVGALVANGQLRGALIEQADEGYHVHVETTLDALNRMGRAYDVSDPRTVSRLLVEKELGCNTRKRFNGVMLRTIFVENEALDDLD